ncbi:MAG: 16S rRNA (guanine(527)-N(7))-methyltransferase RsmG [Pseudomonadota bacterium]
MNEANNFLSKGTESLGLSLAQSQLNNLMSFFEEFIRWNKKINLSAVRDLDDMLSLHGLDSFSVHPWIRGDSIIDVGTGGGLPGIPLSIAFPDKHFCLLDSNGKKTRFLIHIVNLLRLSNVQVHQHRVETYQPKQPFDVVICRAFASIDKIIQQCEHLCGPEGVILAMKGRYPKEEISAIPSDWLVDEVVSLEVPGVTGQRHLVVLRRKSEG